LTQNDISSLREPFHPSPSPAHGSNAYFFAKALATGFATVTFVTPLLSFDFVVMLADFFTHPLSVAYSNDPSSSFAGSSAGQVEPPMLLDFFLFLYSEQSAALALQLAQA
jgi:hypothetical protein